MSDNLYLYTTPFVVKAKSAQVGDYIHDYLSEEERADIGRINDLMMQFAVQQRLVRADDTNFYASPETNMGSWLYLINRMSFRSLVEVEKYQVLIGSLQSGDEHPINMVLDLHARLGALFDHKLLNTVVNRTMSSISLIPYAVEEDKETVSWDRIHVEAPFIWLLIYLQTVIRTTISLGE